MKTPNEGPAKDWWPMNRQQRRAFASVMRRTKDVAKALAAARARGWMGEKTNA